MIEIEHIWPNILLTLRAYEWSTASDFPEANFNHLTYVHEFTDELDKF